MENAFDISTMKEILNQHNQTSLIKTLDTLSPVKTESLLKDLSQVDFALMDKLNQGEGIFHSKKAKLSPAPIIGIPRSSNEKRLEELARNTGEKQIAQGKIAILLVAGGQGSRLGFDGPKGAYPITPLKNKTLFQLHAEKILALYQKYNHHPFWCIMTSRDNHQQTLDFFERHQYFGLNKDRVLFFQQGVLPAVDDNGQLILKNENSLFLSPNGHGGTLEALADSGVLQQLKNNGVEHLFYFQVDNVLIKIPDPVFVGYHVRNQADISLKVLRKRNAEEKVGVVGIQDGKTIVVEYSDLLDEDKYATDHKGQLKYWAASIGIHMISLDFITKLTSGEFFLPYHIAWKKVQTVNSKGEKTELMGKKFERFIFDALYFADKVVNMECKREEDFAPVKNAEGEDSPQTAKQALIDQWNRWLKKAQAIMEPGIIVEISPLFAMEEDEILDKVIPGTEFHKDTYLE